MGAISLWQLRGHDSLTEHLDQALRGGRAAHAYLLVGPPHVGKGTLATNIAQAVNCAFPEDAPCGTCTSCRRIASRQHTDIQVISTASDDDSPAKRQISISTVRELQHQASLKPYEGNCRVYIFDGAEDMSDEAANALLKILEEPPPQVLFLLLTADDEAVLPTIRSRCRRIELHPMPIDAVAEEIAASGWANKDEADVLARLSRGCLGWAMDAMAEPAVMEVRNAQMERIGRLSSASLADRFDYGADLATRYARGREDVVAELNQWLRWWRDILLIKEGNDGFIFNIDWSDTLKQRASEVTTPQVVKAIVAFRDSVEALESNANPRLALEVLMLSLPGRRAEMRQSR